MLTRSFRRGSRRPRRAGRGGVSEGELGEQHGDVVVEPVPGVRAEPIQQLTAAEPRPVMLIRLNDEEERLGKVMRDRR